jgi:predicted RNA binding protein YcfA (HicA-like mRNA interferase family)
MQKLKQLSGRDVVKIFEVYGFIIKRTVGSHVRLTLTHNTVSYHVTVPLHKSLKKGTLHGIVKDFEICFGKKESQKNFFTE